MIYGNVPNRNLIDNLPQGACVEVPCLVDAQGIQPTHVGTLPPQLAALCQSNISVQDLTVEAALTKRREHIYHAVMVDPHTATVLTLDKIWAMCDELIAEHQKHGLLGDFAPTIPGTGRAWRGTGDRIMAEARIEEASLKKGAKAGKQGLTAEVTIANPRAKAEKVELSLAAAPFKGESGRSVPLKVSVPAKGTITRKVALPFVGSTVEGVEIQVLSSSSEVFARGQVTRPRTVLAPEPGKSAAGFELKLAGFPAGKGTIGVQKDLLSLQVAVDDSKITPASRPWEGSGLELFFAPSDGSAIQQFFVVFQPGAKRVALTDAALKPVARSRAQLRPSRTGAGYEVDLEIPLAATGLAAGTRSFLFNLYANLTALGDAHSGGRTSLSGSFNAHVDASRFPRIELAARK